MQHKKAAHKPAHAPAAAPGPAKAQPVNSATQPPTKFVPAAQHKPTHEVNMTLLALGCLVLLLLTLASLSLSRTVISLSAPARGRF